MPLVRLDLIEGRNEAEIASLLDASHRALVSAFGIPERDRYQVVHEHRRANVVFQDSGLAIPRTDRVVLVSITTRPRSEASKLIWSDRCQVTQRSRSRLSWGLRSSKCRGDEQQRGNATRRQCRRRRIMLISA